IGMFVNTLLMRNFPVGTKTFGEFLREVKTHTLAAFENQEYPFEDLVEKVLVKRDAGRNPLFDVMFALQERSGETGESDEGNEVIEVAEQAKFDLTVTAVDAGERLGFAFNYSAKLFKSQTIKRFITYFERLAALAAEQSTARIGDMEILPDEEKKQLLHDFNRRETDFETGKTIQQLFEEQAAKTPGSIALQDHTGETKTFAQLSERSNRLAGYLHGRGVEENHLVGLMVERSFEMIVGILSILEAGAAYVPLNPKAPEARNNYIMRECAAEILLTSRELFEESAFESEILFLDGFAGSTHPTPDGAPLSRGDSKDWEHLGKSPLERGARRVG
ncbi:MAG: AMP-binding protein, partial [bacterium]|nr:AMP-binding protein [bacterium]